MNILDDLAQLLFGNQKLKKDWNEKPPALQLCSAVKPDVFSALTGKERERSLLLIDAQVDLIQYARECARRNRHETLAVNDTISH